jgi:hypothetical protein
LKDRWRETLKARYMIDESNERSHGHLEEWVATLEGIYRDFTRKDSRGRSLADPKFDDQILNGTRKQYEQALAEMLFFDRLRREGFALSPTNGMGPDFKAVKNGVTVWFEVVTPEPDMGGEIDRHFNDIEGRLRPSAGRNDALRRELIFRITTVLDTKLAKLKKDLHKDRMGPNDPCVIVVNDALLCPPDAPQFGVTLDAGAAYDSGWSMILHATRAKGYRYRYPLPHPTESLWARAKPGDTLRNHNHSPISMARFQDPSSAHVSAAFQLTLREDYAVARHLERLAWEQRMTPRGGNMIDALQRGVLVHNPVAVNPLPQLMWVTQVWNADDVPSP